jgi:hypothetical protein
MRVYVQLSTIEIYFLLRKMERRAGGTHSIWISEQLQELGHEVIVAKVRELRAISHSDRKSGIGDTSHPCPPV